METSIRNFVLRAIADDYEDFEMVFSEATKWASEDGRIRVTREEVIRGLEKLIEEGYAKAYLLSSQPPHAKPVPFSAEQIGGLWFYITPKGKALAKTL